MGRDLLAEQNEENQNHFNSHARVGRDVYINEEKQEKHNDFNSHARVGRDISSALGHLRLRSFQLTRPRGARPLYVACMRSRIHNWRTLHSKKFSFVHKIFIILLFFHAKIPRYSYCLPFANQTIITPSGSYVSFVP